MGFRGLQCGVAGDSFDAPDTSRCTLLADNSEQTNVTRSSGMGAAAEFNGKTFPHGQNPHLFGVLFPEKRHGSFCPGRLDTHHLGLNDRVTADLVIHDAFYLPQLRFRDCLEV